MKKRKIVIIDTETGGLDASKQSILSLGAVIVSDGAIEAKYYTLIAEEEIIAEEGALRVNGLTLEQIEQDGTDPYNAAQMFLLFLRDHGLLKNVCIAGHNVAFDIGYLKRLFRLAGIEKEYSRVFSHRSLCTQTGALLLEQAGRIELPGGSASLDSCVKLWGIELDRTAGHNALGDAIATAAVLKKELALMMDAKT